ncbi:leucine-rich repeat neuronal protein 1-like [Zophobas morio]|uniref:leucine-rich repeat neuronal protein 1-like n=1 Tax=Zophobas morio TaxID=2755281 RepID=UPI003082C63C
MYVYLIFSMLMGHCLAQSDPPFCSACSCKTVEQTKFEVTCIRDVRAYLFQDSFWIDSTNKTYPYKTLLVHNTPILTLDKKFPISNITYLSLANNSIVNISDSIFRNLQDMITLDLSYNNIEQIHPDAFDGQYLPDEFIPLKSLKNLHLDHNRISSLNQDVFEHTPNVEILTISHNPLDEIDQQTLVAITSLVFLKQLDLSYTGLSSLPGALLHVPRYLEKLDLSGNQLDRIPKTLGDSHSLSVLYFNNNPIVNLAEENGFPKIPTLKILHLSGMRKLLNITSRALSNLENLEELFCYDNPELSHIDKDALSARRDGAEYETWPPIKKLYLQENKLSHIDMQLILQWKDLTELDLTDNPWTCEGENQWIVDELMPIYLKLDEQKAKRLRCGAPIEMVALTFRDVYKRQTTMRCLDLYGHRSERDGALLIGILIGVLITIPVVLFLIYVYQRHRFGLFDNSPAGFSRQFYKKTSSEDGPF